ncbi:unnamed protein product [Darwinula stevensoni]|uniref:Uncharacterized protein n=1 Tax=Darwinula stevensoni TaxID=69355 RepID=A0A7R9ADS7_9CRUS|nr:unnamed protein product [Darwinula stevensoni]CAG0901611.1 unnamed protein product [Darwinula stevensoni]
MQRENQQLMHIVQQLEPYIKSISQLMERMSPNLNSPGSPGVDAGKGSIALSLPPPLSTEESPQSALDNAGIEQLRECFSGAPGSDHASFALREEHTGSARSDTENEALVLDGTKKGFLSQLLEKVRCTEEKGSGRIRIKDRERSSSREDKGGKSLSKSDGELDESGIGPLECEQCAAAMVAAAAAAAAAQGIYGTGNDGIPDCPECRRYQMAQSRVYDNVPSGARKREKSSHYETVKEVKAMVHQEPGTTKKGGSGCAKVTERDRRRYSSATVQGSGSSSLKRGESASAVMKKQNSCENFDNVCTGEGQLKKADSFEGHEEAVKSLVAAVHETKTFRKKKK